MIMPNPTPKKKRTVTPPRRIRLTHKQTRFLTEVFGRGCSMQDAMDRLRIWPRLLYKWLQEPRFLEAIECKVAQYQIEAHIDAARAAPYAIHKLAYMDNTPAQFETIRKASVDLLKFLDSMNAQKGGTRGSRGGAQAARSGAPLARTGAQVRPVARENIGNTTDQSPANQRLQPENKENHYLPDFLSKLERVHTDEK